MHDNDNDTITCPFCDEGALEPEKCPTCGKKYLLCDECDSVYKNAKSLHEECDAGYCPFCHNEL